MSADLIQRAKTLVKEVVGVTVIETEKFNCIVTSNRTEVDSVIANHFLSGSKYGIAGSDGSWVSNYYLYTINNHEILSLFLANSKNPFDKKRRFLVLWCKLSFSLFLSSVIDAITKASHAANDPFFSNYAGTGLIVALIIGPYGYILQFISSCAPCTRNNVCGAVKWVGFALLISLALGSIAFVIAGALLATYVLGGSNYISIFFLSIFFDSFSYFYLGIWNWVFLSWEGCLLLPILPIGEKGFPSRFYPILGFWPVKFVLQMVHMGFPTYEEDKREFQKQFPGRISIDCVPYP